MGLQGILLYTGRAMAFALCIGILWFFKELVVNTGKLNFLNRRFCLELVFVCYIAALVQIIVIRDFTSFFSFWERAHSLSSIQFIPLKTTLAEVKNDLWPFLYHVVGNMIWFVPFGTLAPALLPYLRKFFVFLVFAVCCSLCLEILQWTFVTGISDVDDILLNALGAAAGWPFWRTAYSKIVKTDSK